MVDDPPATATGAVTKDDEALMRLYEGNDPEPGWLLGQTEKFKVWATPGAVDTWRRIKITAIEPMPKKGNYWTGYCVKEQRFANSKDWQALKKHIAKPMVQQIVNIVYHHFK